MTPHLPADDIPVARRSRAPILRPRTPWQRLRWLLIGGGFAIVALGGMLMGPLRQLLVPPPVPGLDARVDKDGRLLGHFPYPEAPRQELVSLGAGLALRADAARALTAMLDAARRQGVKLELLSAFRDWELQNELFFHVKSERNQTALDRARVSAPPGFSEHSTGYAIDLGDADHPSTHLSEAFESTPAFGWLVENAGRYHFRLSFPRDNPQGVGYEPWHWRYEGNTEALKLFEPSQRLARTGSSAGGGSRTGEVK